VVEGGYRAHIAYEDKASNRSRAGTKGERIKGASTGHWNKLGKI
jgi:hypothetical protein